jgi:RNA methyltransferase, TrmH family
VCPLRGNIANLGKMEAVLEPMITSLSNPLVKKVRALRQRKVRSSTELFIVEGIHHVGEAVAAGWNIDSIIYTPDNLTSDFARRLTSNFPSKLQEVSSEVMESIAEKDHPSGLIAIVHQKPTTLNNVVAIQTAAALIAPQDPGNVGTILRTVDAVGADAVFLLEGGVDPYHPTCIRASMGTIFWKPIVQSSFGEFIGWARGKNIQIIGSSAHAERDYQTLQPFSNFVLLFGSEQKGLSPEHIKSCDEIVSVPMRGRASSLNLAVAASILLYHYRRPG